MTEEDKLFKSPEEKKREEKLVEEKPQKTEKAEAAGEKKEATAEETEKEKAKKAIEAIPAVSKKEEKKEAKKEEKKKEKGDGKEKEKKREIVLQRVFVVPLEKAYFKPRSHRARVATRLLKAFIAKHMKVALKNVRIAPELNSLVRRKGDRKPAKKIRVNASKDKDGIALAEPAK